MTQFRNNSYTQIMSAQTNFANEGRHTWKGRKVNIVHEMEHANIICTTVVTRGLAREH